MYHSCNPFQEDLPAITNEEVRANIAPLLSRCQVLVLHPLEEDDIKNIVTRALGDTQKGLGHLGLQLDDEAMRLLVRSADGDSRRALNYLETAAFLVTGHRSQKQCSVCGGAQGARRCDAHRLAPRSSADPQRPHPADERAWLRQRL